MEIAELSKLLEKKINEKMLEFHRLGKESKDLTEKLNKKIDECHKKMYNILLEMEPVEYIVKHQNPNIIPLFEAVKEYNQIKSKDTNDIS